MQMDKWTQRCRLRLQQIELGNRYNNYNNSNYNRGKRLRHSSKELFLIKKYNINYLKSQKALFNGLGLPCLLRIKLDEVLFDSANALEKQATNINAKATLNIFVFNFKNLILFFQLYFVNDYTLCTKISQFYTQFERSK